MDIKVSGFGGQGIIRIGMILGKAASLYGGKEATLTQSFGPEARGGACSAQLVVSEGRILYPYLTKPEILICMSQEAYEKFEPGLKEDGILLLEEDLVRPHPTRGSIRQYSIQATRIAEGLGNRLYANLVMLGFIVAITALVPKQALLDALPGTVPDRLLQKNIEAFEKGHAIGLEKLAATA
ncbi:pyruvate ferredoxin oxidoreductase [candidate division WOR-3 bacterium]|nr:pyruvate ferredoxin oxidoreductase [candidate division WOR-3 bacterium]